MRKWRRKRGWNRGRGDEIRFTQRQTKEKGEEIEEENGKQKSRENKMVKWSKETGNKKARKMRMDKHAQWCLSLSCPFLLLLYHSPSSLTFSSHIHPHACIYIYVHK